MTLKSFITLPSLSSASAALALVLSSSCADQPANITLPGTAASPATPSAPGAPAASDSAPTTASPASKRYPIAYPLLDKAGKPVKNVYISPFRPHNPINTKGFRSGEVAGDPSTMKKDPKTGKGIKSSAKIFRLQ